MWVDYKPIDDGYRSIYLILIHEVHVLELKQMCLILESFHFFSPLWKLGTKKLRGLYTLLNPCSLSHRGESSTKKLPGPYTFVSSGSSNTWTSYISVILNFREDI